ncbi:MAG: ABC transporter permease subunit [Polyangiales bacterium]
MFSFIARRSLAAIPALLAFAIVLFLAIALSPAPGGLDEGERARRFQHLPVLINVDPDDRPRIVARMVARLPAEVGEQRQRDIARLLSIGAAGLPDLVPALDKLEPLQRARIARELAPLAFRMGLEDVGALEDPKRAEGFFRHALDERGPDLRPASVRRALSRHLKERDEPLYARQIRNADTALLAPVLDEIDSGAHDADEQAELAVLAVAAARRSGAEHVNDLPTLRAWWIARRADYVELGTLERVAARITETRFGRWVVHAVTQRFGVSWRTDQPVLDDLRHRARTTLPRAAFALLLAYAIAVPIGLLSAARRFGAIDRTTNVVLVVLHGIPAFVLAIAAQGLSPSLVRRDAFVIVAVAIVAVAPIARHLRSRLLEEVRLEYVRTARAIGVSPFRLWTRTIGRNVLGPLAAFAAVELPAIFAATLLVEEILALDGLGPATMAAVRARDVPWLMAFALFLGAASAAALVIADVVQALNDPRVRRSLSHQGEAEPLEEG